MTELPAVSALKRYLKDNGLSINAFSRMHRMSPSELSKILRGLRQRISVEQAAQIQDATGGTVDWRLWIPTRGQHAFDK